MNYGKIQFNSSAVKSLTVDEFKKLYESKLGKETESVYYKITGFTKKRKPKKSLED